MIHRIAFVVALFMSIISCNNNDKPDDLIPKNEMIEIMSDINLAEGALKIYQIYPDSIRKYAPVYYETVYKKHKVSSQQYKNSYNYYYQNPEEMGKMMDKVSEELSKKESGIEKDTLGK